MIKVAITGSSNVGKTTTLNAISGSCLHVGNLHGTTVEIQEVFCKSQNQEILFSDLPGLKHITQETNIFNCNSKQESIFTDEEQITINFLKNTGKYNVILHVVDARTLHTELILLQQLLELNKPIIIALNFAEEISCDTIKEQPKEIEKAFGVTVIPIDPIGKINTKKLVTHIKQHNDRNTQTTHKTVPSQVRIQALIQKTHKLYHKSPYNNKPWQQKFDKIALHKFFGFVILLGIMSAMFGTIFEFGDSICKQLSAIVYNIVTMIAKYTPKQVSVFGKTINTSIISFAIKDGIAPGVATVIEFLPKIIILNFWIMILEMTGYMTRASVLLNKTLERFGMQGQSVFSLLSGFGCSVPAYISTRTLPNSIDRFSTMIAISFIPCHAKMIVTIFFVNIFFPSHPTLVMITMYTGTVILGLIMAKIASKIKKRSKNSQNTKIKLPPYQKPQFKLIYKSLQQTAKHYIRDIGKVIITLSFLLWLLSHTPYNAKDMQYKAHIQNIYNGTCIPITSEESQNNNINQIHQQAHSKTHNQPPITNIKPITEEERQMQSQKCQNTSHIYILKHSILGKLGKISNFAFEPLGFDWKLSLSIYTAVVAREVALATFGVLYFDYLNPNSISQSVKNNIPLPSALSYACFMLLWVPCISAFTTFWKEREDKREVVIFFIINTAISWLITFTVYHATMAIIA